MSTWVIFGVGVFVTLLVAAGMFFTVLEFRDIEKHPEEHEPKRFTGAKTRVEITNFSGRRVG